MSHYFLCSQNKDSINHRFFQIMVSDFVAAEFPKTPSPNPARIPPPTPPAGGKSAEAKRKILFPRKIDFRFAESVLKPHALPEYLEGRNPKKNVLSIFKKKSNPAKSKKQETFFFGVAGVLASAWGLLRIICFGNRCEFGTIETPESNLTIFSKPEGGTREARPNGFPPFFQTNSEFLARWRALIFRRGGGSKSEAILTHSICFDTKRIFAILNLPPPKIAYFNDHLWFHFEQS